MDGVTAGSGGLAAGDLLTNVEIVIGSDFSDTIFSNSSSQEVSGGDGNDTLYLGDRFQDLFGEDGNDVLVLDADILSFNSTTRTLDGGAGTDTVRFQSASSTSFELNSTALTSIERLQFDSLAADADIILNVVDDDFAFLTGGTIQIIGDNAAGATETLFIEMTNVRYNATTVDLSGLTFSSWGGQGETVVIEGHLDMANTITGSSVNDVLTMT